MMCGSNSDPLQLAAPGARRLQSVSLGFEMEDVDTGLVDVLETRLALTTGVRKSLSGPMTALVAQVEACLVVLDGALAESQTEACSENALAHAATLLRNASKNAKQMVGLLQYWKSLQHLTPGRKCYVNLGQLTLDCIDMLRSQTKTERLRIDTQVSSSRQVYVDQYHFAVLMQSVLCYVGTGKPCSGHSSHVECKDDGDQVLIRVRQKVSDSGHYASETSSVPVGSFVDIEATHRNISQQDIDLIAEIVRETGGRLQWSVVTTSELDFGVSFRSPRTESLEQ